MLISHPAHRSLDTRYPTRAELITKLVELWTRTFFISDEAFSALVENLLSLNGDQGFQFWLGFEKAVQQKNERVLVEYVAKYVPANFRPRTYPKSIGWLARLYNRFC